MRTPFLTGLFSLAAAAALAQGRDFSAVEVATIKVVDGVHMLQGAGGNVGVLTGADGAIVIDDDFEPVAPKVIAAVNALSPGGIAFLLNTHFHGDHTGGNALMDAAGARIVAHDNVRKRLKDGLARASGSVTPPAPAAALPVVTFSQRTTFYWNDREVRVIHPEGPAHTDGDAFVHFADANVIHAGDLFFTGGFPYVDLEGGGDLDGYIAAQEKILSLADAKTKIIPGHGPLSTKGDLAATVAMLKDARQRIQALVDRGLDEEAVVAAAPLADLDAEWGQGFIKTEFMTRTAYKSLARKKTPAQ